jgi:hypothetical protein
MIKRDGDMTQVEERLPTNHQTPGLPKIKKNNRIKKKRKLSLQFG